MEAASSCSEQVVMSFGAKIKSPPDLHCEKGSLIRKMSQYGGGGDYDLHCSHPPGGDLDVLALFLGSCHPTLYAVDDTKQACSLTSGEYVL